MGAFGEKLRREREMRGVTLDEISESTKISRRHLESLEKEDFDALPGGIFNKGFVRAYARYLGLDEDQAVADYSSLSTEEPASPDQFPLDVHEKPNRELNPKRSSLPLLWAVLALLAVLVVLWARNRARHAEPPGNAAAPAAATSEKVAEPAPAQAGATPSVTPAGGLTPAAASSSSSRPARSITPSPE